MLQVLLYRAEKWRSEKVKCFVKLSRIKSHTDWHYLAYQIFHLITRGQGPVYDDLITKQVEKIPSENNDFDSLVKYNYTQIKKFQIRI